ncbi:hypothetical protein C8Q78DRAFT_989394 [Trametes maxima]|nr:hypothetical protein C8Q78DRAFT_989394 [Trametes maxima]
MSDANNSTKRPAGSLDYASLVKKAAQQWTRRFSHSIDPLADVGDGDTESLQSLEDCQYMTATPNTPSSICFPDSRPNPASPAGVQERTPKSSLSQQSDSTAVATPEARLGEIDVKDIEHSAGQLHAQCGVNVPLAIRKRVQGTYAVFMASLAILLEVWCWYSKKHDGFKSPWLKASDVSVNSLAKIGLARVEDFMDMTNFQAASSFASADVMYNVSSPPFISNGYTVAEFELPDSGVNGTVYANRSAVLSQASCAIPDSLAMVHPVNDPTIWHNTVLFGQCTYTWTVNSNATYLYGVVPADFTNCRQDFASVPLQYRPVLFWFFTYEPQPSAALVLCTPHASGQPVSVALDLATGATDVTPLQNSPADADTANVGAFAYNGVFFDETSLDQTALARLQAIQQQLPGAVFEAARTRDPALMRSFSSRGFKDLAQDVYSTYLSLVAKIVYFVEDEEPISVRVGSECKRFFVVEAVAHLLTAAFAAVVLLTVGLTFGLRRILSVLPIPPRLGTLGAAIWLTAQTDVALSLGDDAVDAQHFAERLAGHRYFLDRASGRIMSVPSEGKERRASLPARVRGELGAAWQKATARASKGSSSRPPDDV